MTQQRRRANLILTPMFIRKTTTRNKSTSESYFTHRLMASERVGHQVRQITLLNLGRHFDLPKADWPRLGIRIGARLAGHAGLLPETDAIETPAQRYTARLIADRPSPVPPGKQTEPAAPTPQPSFAEVDVDALQLTRPRSIGVEAAGLAAMRWLEIDPTPGGVRKPTV